MSAQSWWTPSNAIGQTACRFESRDEALASIPSAIEIEQDAYIQRLTPELSNELQSWIIHASQEEMDVWLRQRYDAIGYAETYTLEQWEAHGAVARPTAQATRHVILLAAADPTA